MIQLRALGPDDWRLWRELRLAALSEAPHAFEETLPGWQGDRDNEERWRGRLSIASSHNVVAFTGDRALGMVTGVPAGEPDAVELISLWVSPDSRGRGVADRLIEEVARWGRRSGATVLRLSVMDDNPAAVALYQRHGFRETGEPARVGATRRKLSLEKRLPRDENDRTTG